ncbi:MAG: ankyrin repeat domain-containing protein [Legionella sp.]|jgi:ankyrin repeat protein
MINNTKIQLIKNKLTEAASLVQANFHPENYANLVEKVLQLELQQEISIIENLLHQPDQSFEYAIQKRLNERATDSLHCIPYSKLPESHVNKLYWEIATIIFEEESNENLSTFINGANYSNALMPLEKNKPEQALVLPQNLFTQALQDCRSNFKELKNAETLKAFLGNFSAEQRIQLLNWVDIKGNTACFYVIQDADTLKVLIDAIPYQSRIKLLHTINANRETLFHKAAKYPESLRLLLNTVKTSQIPVVDIIDLFNTKDSSGYTLWHYVSENPQTLKELLICLQEQSMTSDQLFELILVRDIIGNTLLHSAIPNPESFKLLFSSLTTSQKNKILEIYNNDRISVFELAASYPKTFTTLVSLIPNPEVSQSIELFIKSLPRTKGVANPLINREFLNELIHIVSQTRNPELLRVTDRKGKTLWYYAEDYPECRTQLLNLMTDSEVWNWDNKSELATPTDTSIYSEFNYSKLIKVIKSLKTNLEMEKTAINADLLDTCTALIYKIYSFHFQKDHSEQEIALFNADFEELLTTKHPQQPNETNNNSFIDICMSRYGQLIDGIEILATYSGRNHSLQVQKLECLFGWDDIKQQMTNAWKMRFAQLKACTDKDSEQAQLLWHTIINDTTVKESETILIYAVKKGYKDIVEHLLRRPLEHNFALSISNKKNALSSAEDAQEQKIAALIRDKLKALLLGSIAQINQMKQLRGWDEVAYYLERPDIAGKWYSKLYQLMEWQKLPHSEQTKQIESIYHIYKDLISICTKNIGEHEYDEHGLIWEAFYEGEKGNLELFQQFLNLPGVMPPLEMLDYKNYQHTKSLLLKSVLSLVLKNTIILDGIEELEGWNDVVQNMKGKDWLDEVIALREWAKSSMSEKSKSNRKISTQVIKVLNILFGNQSILIYASRKGYKDIVASLRFIMSNITDSDNKNALMAAIETKNHEIIKLLLNSPMDINAKDITGSTALMIAVRNKDYGSISLLLEHANIDLSIVNNEGMNALFIAIKNQDSKSLNLLLHSAQSNPNLTNKDGMTALMFAIENNDIQSIQILLQTPDINVLTKNNQGLTALMLAVKLNNTSIVAMLLQTNKFDLKSEVNHKLNILSLAKEVNNPEMLFIIAYHMHVLDERYENESLGVKLLNIVDEIDKIIKSITFPRYISIPSWNVERNKLRANPDDDNAYQALLKKFNERNADGCTCITTLGFYCGTQMLDLLLQIPGVDVNSQNYAGFSLLMTLCVENNYKKIAYLLGVPGINVRLTNKNGDNALMIAVSQLKIESIKELLQAPGLDILAKNKDNRTVLDIATKYRDKGIYPADIKLDPGSNHYQKDLQCRENYKDICELIENKIKELSKQNDTDSTLSNSGSSKLPSIHSLANFSIFRPESSNSKSDTYENVVPSI